MAVLVLRLHLSTREFHLTMDFHLYVRGLEIIIVWSKNDSYTGTINIWLHVILKHAILYFIKSPTPRWGNNLILNLISLICTKDALTRNLQHIKLTSDWLRCTCQGILTPPHPPRNLPPVFYWAQPNWPTLTWTDLKAGSHLRQRSWLNWLP